jgi:radical SAM superfamily enzyme YgiQ (UPF0313 family)
MKVLIANPPAYFKRYPNRHFIQAGSRWSHTFYCSRRRYKKHYQPYPFFIGYASALLKRDIESQVRAFDASALDFDENYFIKYVKSYSPDLLVVEVPSISFPLMKEVLKDIKEGVDCKIAVAGLHATAFPHQILQNYGFIDFVLVGEYEKTLKDLVVSNLEGDPESIKGMEVRRNGAIKSNLQRNLCDLNELPYPDRDDLPITLYHDFEIVGEPTIQMTATRGCPYRCKFCYITILYDKSSYRKRTIEKVVDEMAYAKEKFRAKQIYFDDDTLGLDKRYLRGLAKEITQRKLDIPWAFMGDITIDYDTMRLLAHSSCVGIKFSVETVGQDSLKHVSKRFITISRVKKFVDRCKSLGIWAHATFMVGLPEDTEEDILATIRFAIELDPDSIQVSIATPLPGTPFYYEAKREGWLVTRDYTLYDGANYSVVSYPQLSRERIEELHGLFVASWKRYILKRYLREPIRLLKMVRVMINRYY